MTLLGVSLLFHASRTARLLPECPANHVTFSSTDGAPANRNACRNLSRTVGVPISCMIFTVVDQFAQSTTV
ncbi:hypothetical protein BDV40DRAFT_278053 [Aspergillus tamarii]|uniref:Secreted protein n=1 Tax=Aspergillus tamarii TaxID=41984 RepID=A0A5N6UGA5_ASPTM|nr:hypothetical protein BDV40DRAFT_278053 [Aspergillus tamarii]